MKIFLDEFDLGNFKCQRLLSAPQAPDLKVLENVSKESELGKTTLQFFGSNATKKMYVRLYDFETEEIAWYRAELAQAPND